MAVRMKWSSVVLAGLAGTGVLAVAGWLLATADRTKPEGTWRSGPYFLELRKGGEIGRSSLPAGVCGGSRYRPDDLLIELDGTWEKEFEPDAGRGVRVEAVRKDGGGTCTFWASIGVYGGGIEKLGFSMEPSPVKELLRES
ncbi:hypothetical protein [Kitasatospora sp. NPDC057541]|uniref:hypothetical protein n=1 Tax=unclassified Kitasatospora TaxID=2633591 RepID=UPI00368DA6AD